MYYVWNVTDCEVSNVAVSASYGNHNSWHFGHSIRLHRRTHLPNITALESKTRVLYMIQVEIHNNSEMLLWLPYMKTLIHKTVYRCGTIVGAYTCQVSWIIGHIWRLGKLIGVKVPELICKLQQRLLWRSAAYFDGCNTQHYVIASVAPWEKNP